MTETKTPTAPQKKARTELILVAASLVVLMILHGGNNTNMPSGASSSSSTNAMLPDHLPRTAHKALGMARYWKRDAQLVGINVEQNLDFAPTFSFLSPSDNSRMDITTDTSGNMTPHPTGSGINGYSAPLPAKFIDLPAAVSAARKQGMPNTVKMAILDIEGNPPAPLWSLQVESDQPPYMYYVDAVNGTVPGNAQQQDSAPASSNNTMAWMLGSKNPLMKGGKSQPSAESTVLWDKANEMFEHKDYRGALPVYEEAAKQGNPRAMAVLGNMYHEGLGVSPDPAKAIEWYKQAAELGNRGAQYSLGGMYEDGEGTSVDVKEAARLYEQSARQGMPEAQFALGLSYEFGEGVARNRRTAIYWLDQAAAQGDGRAKWHADWLSRPDTPEFKDEAAFGQYISGKVSAKVWREMAVGNNAPLPSGNEPVYDRQDRAAHMDQMGDHNAAIRCANGGTC